MFQKANQIGFMMSEVTYSSKRERERERERERKRERETTIILPGFQVIPTTVPTISQTKVPSLSRSLPLVHQYFRVPGTFYHSLISFDHSKSTPRVLAPASLRCGP